MYPVWIRTNWHPEDRRRCGLMFLGNKLCHKLNKSKLDLQAKRKILLILPVHVVNVLKQFNAVRVPKQSLQFHR